MKPLASAMRYGPFLAGYWKNFVSLVHGTKQSGSADGPDTVFGPASDDAEFRAQAAVISAATAALRNSLRVRVMSSSLLLRSHFRVGLPQRGTAQQREAVVNWSEADHRNSVCDEAPQTRPFPDDPPDRHVGRAL